MFRFLQPNVCNVNVEVDPTEETKNYLSVN
jgi:hypothetical protein